MIDDKIEARKEEWKESIAENIDKGEQVFSLYKGEALQRLSGRMTDQESLSLGNFNGITNITLNTIKTTEEGLNKLSSMGPSLVPIMKKTKKGIIPVTDEQEAIKEGKIENLDIINIEGVWYFKHPGMEIDDDSKYIMTDFIYNIARASGSLQGETKQAGLQAISNLRVVPTFAQGPMITSDWGSASMPDEEDGE